MDDARWRWDEEKSSLAPAHGFKIVLNYVTYAHGIKVIANVSKIDTVHETILVLQLFQFRFLFRNQVNKILS